MDSGHLQNGDKIREFTAKLDVAFHFVLITEKMSESLVLLADLLKIPLEKVKSLSMNVRPYQDKVITL